MPAYGLGTYGLGTYGIGEEPGVDEAVYLGDFAFRVDFAPDDGPRAATPVYTSIASHVKLGDGPLVMQRGRSNEQSGAQPGTGSMSLGNTDGRFTMGNATSPYAPLKLRRPVRCRVTYDGITYPLWQGHVDDWGNVSQSTVGRARLSMSDRLARAAGTPMRSAIEAEIHSDAPVGLWPLTDIPGSRSAASSGTEFGAAAVLPNFYTDALWDARIVFGADFTPGPDSLTAADFGTDGFEGEYLRAVADGTFTATGFTMEAWVDVPTLPIPTAVFKVVDWQTLILEITDQGLVTSYINGVGTAATSTLTVHGSGWHHIAATWTVVGTTATIRVYVDGALSGSTSFAYGSTIEAGAEVTIGADYVPVNTNMYAGSMSHVAVHAQALSAARIADHANAGRGWVGETSTARFLRHCRNAGLQATQYAADGTGHTEMGPQPQAGSSLFDVLTACADAENGVLYVDADGVLRFSARTIRYNTTPQLVLDATKAGHVHAEAEVRTDTLLLVNNATATRPGGTPQTVVNQVSFDDYDDASKTRTLHVKDDVICLNWAQWQVAANGEPLQRLESVDVDVVSFVASGGVLGDLLNTDINARIQATNLPAASSGTTTLDLFVEGIQHRVEKSRWVLRFITSPVGINDGIWQLGQGLLGADTRLGF